MFGLCIDWIHVNDDSVNKLRNLRLCFINNCYVIFTVDILTVDILTYVAKIVDILTVNILTVDILESRSKCRRSKCYHLSVNKWIKKSKAKKSKQIYLTCIVNRFYVLLCRRNVKCKRTSRWHKNKLKPSARYFHIFIH